MEPGSRTVNVDLVTHPAGAAVEIDGRDYALRTPAHLELSPGDHTLVLRRPDYETQEERFLVKESEANIFEFKLVAEPRFVELPRQPLSPRPGQKVVAALQNILGDETWNKRGQVTPRELNRLIGNHRVALHSDPCVYHALALLVQGDSLKLGPKAETADAIRLLDKAKKVSPSDYVLHLRRLALNHLIQGHDDQALSACWEYLNKIKKSPNLQPERYAESIRFTATVLAFVDGGADGKSAPVGKYRRWEGWILRLFDEPEDRNGFAIDKDEFFQRVAFESRDQAQPMTRDDLFPLLFQEAPVQLERDLLLQSIDLEASADR